MLPCTFTQGFWKNHPTLWPVSSLTLGGHTYNENQLIALMQLPSVGDASLILADQLIAAKLNVLANGGTDAVAQTIAQADLLLGMFSARLPLGISPSTTVGTAMVSLGDALDRYNNSNDRCELASATPTATVSGNATKTATPTQTRTRTPVS